MFGWNCYTLIDLNGNIRVWGRSGEAPPPPILPCINLHHFIFKIITNIRIYSWGCIFSRFLRKVELDIWISGGSQGYIQCRPEDLGVMIFKFPEYGSLRWHGVLNQAWKCIFQKLEKYTPGGQTKIGSYYILNILYSWKWKMSQKAMETLACPSFARRRSTWSWSDRFGYSF